MEEDPYKAARSAFDTYAERYEICFGQLDNYNDTFDVFCTMLPENARVLEAGCGPGNITRYLLRKRADLQITATDIAPAMIALAQSLCTNALFYVLDVREITQAGKDFDALLCGFVNPYLSRTDCINLLRDAAMLLRENGLLYISTIEGKYNHSKWTYSSSGEHRTFQYYYSQSDWEILLAENGFKIEHYFHKTLTLQNRPQESGIIFIARKH